MKAGSACAERGMGGEGREGRGRGGWWGRGARPSTAPWIMGEGDNKKNEIIRHSRDYANGGPLCSSEVNRRVSETLRPVFFSPPDQRKKKKRIVCD